MPSIILGLVFVVIGVICSFIIIIDAFRNEAWKGILAFFCGLYLLYYAIAEFQHQNKWLIIGGALAGGLIGGALMGMGSASAVAGSTGAPLGR